MLFRSTRTKSLADRYYGKAKKLLDQLSDSAKRERLSAILDQIKERHF